jgi:hypothetical protein
MSDYGPRPGSVTNIVDIHTESTDAQTLQQDLLNQGWCRSRRYLVCVRRITESHANSWTFEWADKAALFSSVRRNDRLFKKAQYE